MRFLEIGLLLDGLFDYFGQLQAVDFIRESSSCGGEKKWQMVTHQSEFMNSSMLTRQRHHGYFDLRSCRSKVSCFCWKSDNSKCFILQHKADKEDFGR